jgi:hypothetical protein
MKIAFLISLLAAVLQPCVMVAQDAPVAPPADPALVSGYGVANDDLLLQARQRAIRFAGAFANDGYKLRDGAWSFNLAAGEPRVLAIFLFAGNEMWFSAAGATPESRPQLALFDSSGKPVAAQSFHHDGLTALGLEVPFTGMFYLRAFTTEDSTPFSLVTSYK